MWTRGRFANEYVPGLFAVAVDSYEKKRAASMWDKLVKIKTSKKSYEENAIRSGLTNLREKGEGAAITFDDQIAGPKQKWVHAVKALGCRISEEAIEDNLYELNGGGEGAAKKAVKPAAKPAAAKPAAKAVAKPADKAAAAPAATKAVAR